MLAEGGGSCQSTPKLPPLTLTAEQHLGRALFLAELGPQSTPAPSDSTQAELRWVSPDAQLRLFGAQTQKTPTSTIFMGSASQRASTWHRLHPATKRLLALAAYRLECPLTWSNMKTRQASSGHNSRAQVPQTHDSAHSSCMYLSEVHANTLSTSPLPPYLVSHSFSDPFLQQTSLEEPVCNRATKCPSALQQASPLPAQGGRRSRR